MSLGKLAKLLKENKLKGTHSSGATRHYLNTGNPTLNRIVSGNHRRGLPSGQVVMIAGPSASGKTVVSTELMISSQDQGGFAAFFDYETQYQMELAKHQGLDVDEEKFAYYKPSTFEEGITDAFKLAKLIRENEVISKDAPIVFVFDSLHAMTPKAKYDALMDPKGLIEKGESLTMNLKLALASACSAWFEIISREFDKYGVTAIFLNQVRTKTSHTGATIYTFPGGDTAYFYCSTVLLLTGSDTVTGAGDDKLLVKKDIKFVTRKSRNTRPLQTAHADFVFDDNGNGSFDVLGSYIGYLAKLGVIKQGGGWYTIGDDKYRRNEIADKYGLEGLMKLHDAFLASGGTDEEEYASETEFAVEMERA